MKASHNKLILVVEEDKTSVKMTFSVLKGFLGSHPFRIELAENAEEIFRVIRTEYERFGQLPALIFLDPLVKGLRQSDLFSELRERYPTIPKILYSARGNREKHAALLQEKEVLCLLPQPWDGLYQANLLRKTLGI